MKNVVILGASGFVGQELYNMCKAHPNINLSALSANKSAGELVNDKELGQSLRYQTIENKIYILKVYTLNFTVSK